MIKRIVVRLQIIAFLILSLFNLKGFCQGQNYAIAESLSDIYSWNKYPAYNIYVEFMQHYADISPYCKLDTIGYSAEGRLILALKLSSSPEEELNKPKFFYSSAIHGNELTGSVLLMRLIDTLLSDNSLNSIVSDLQLYICPFANPDGTWAGGDNNVRYATRTNANSVDLNRNFPDFSQDNIHPDGNATQGETAAFMEYALKNHFNMSCNMHTGSEVFNYPFDCYTSNQKIHADRDWFIRLGNSFVANLNNAPYSYFKSVTSSGIIDGGDWYVITGGRQDWHTYYAHCPEVTLELSDDYMPKSNDLPNYWKYLKNSLFVFFDFAKRGVQGVVKDSLTSENLNDAMITIINHDRDSSQVFTNQNGYYFRPLLSGSYDIEFSKPGYNSKTLHIDYTQNLQDLDVYLSKSELYLQEISKKEIILYPNPADNILKAYVFEKSDYEIFNYYTKIKQGSFVAGENEINIEDLSAGYYFLKVIGRDNSVTVLKFIKQ